MSVLCLECSDVAASCNNDSLCKDHCLQKDHNHCGECRTHTRCENGKCWYHCDDVSHEHCSVFKCIMTRKCKDSSLYCKDHCKEEGHGHCNHDSCSTQTTCNPSLCSYHCFESDHSHCTNKHCRSRKCECPESTVCSHHCRNEDQQSHCDENLCGSDACPGSSKCNRHCKQKGHGHCHVCNTLGHCDKHCDEEKHGHCAFSDCNKKAECNNSWCVKHCTNTFHDHCSTQGCDGKTCRYMSGFCARCCTDNNHNHCKSCGQNAMCLFSCGLCEHCTKYCHLKGHGHCEKQCSMMVGCDDRVCEWCCQNSSHKHCSRRGCFGVVKCTESINGVCVSCCEQPGHGHCSIEKCDVIGLQPWTRWERLINGLKFVLFSDKSSYHETQCKRWHGLDGCAWIGRHQWWHWKTRLSMVSST